MSAKSVVIGGGTGFIGTHLSNLLKKSGYNVLTVSRMPGYDRITWHELNEKGLPNDTIAAVNVAGQNVLDPSRRWTSGFQQNVWNSRINTTTSFVRAITNAKTKPNIFISVSGVSLYRPSDSKIYNEDDKGEDFDYMSNLCLNWEKAAELPANETTRLVRIRSGVVIGSNGGMIKSLKLPFWFGFGGKIGDGTQPLPWIHIEDLCQMIKYSIETEKVNGVLNGVAPDIITNGDFTKAFGAAMRRPTFFTTPAFVIQQLFGKERAALLLTGAKIHPKRTLELGYQYKYPKVIDACREVC
ncbi:epimerase family protein SDR39U1 [Contarinia nasturtii]|uniref:epimerase family protein SDR39U1 n=1 Tax=Contarinia nasturtii TaxID=265458 RepID=UPI0012D4A962|nr:epimerase family protein SDR39U1 [Contarinia nasturtii]